MRTKSFALLGLALGCGLIASIGISQVLATKHTETHLLTGETDDIFVAAQEVSMGEFLTPQTVRLEPWPKDRVPAGAIRKFEGLDNRRTKTKIFAGEAILENKLFAKGEGYFPTTMIPKNYRVVAVKADTQTAGGNLLNPGDRVDVMVYLTRNEQHGIRTTGTRMVLENIKVFAVNDVVGIGADKDGRTIKATSVSLLVKPEQSARLLLASEMGQIRLSLRGPESEEDHGKISADTNDLLETTAAGDEKDESLVDDKPAPGGLMDLLKGAANAATPPPSLSVPVTPVAPSWTIRVIKSGAVEDVLLEEETADPAHPGAARWKTSTPMEPAATGGVAPSPTIEPAQKPTGGDAAPPAEPVTQPD